MSPPDQKFPALVPLQDDVMESCSALSLDVAVRALQDGGLLPPSDSFHPLVVDLPRETADEVTESSEERIGKRV